MCDDQSDESNCRGKCDDQSDEGDCAGKCVMTNGMKAIARVSV